MVTTGILSIVADTFDLWKLITEYLPALKEEILARDGKLVIRPDSGNPVDIICRHIVFDVIKDVYCSEEIFEEGYTAINANGYVVNKSGKRMCDSEVKGVIELLWDIFGGTINKQGYKVLDSHIGAIYGDSINLERQVNIYSKLKNKQFASTNIVLGVGSYTYVMLTRDSAGYAAKGAWFEVKENNITNQFNIYKDPITDDTKSKKSLKGFQFVFQDKDGNYKLKSHSKNQQNEYK